MWENANFGQFSYRHTSLITVTIFILLPVLCGINLRNFIYATEHVGKNIKRGRRKTAFQLVVEWCRTVLTFFSYVLIYIYQHTYFFKCVCDCRNLRFLCREWGNLIGHLEMVVDASRYRPLQNRQGLQVRSGSGKYASVNHFEEDVLSNVILSKYYRTKTSRKETVYSA